MAAGVGNRTTLAVCQVSLPDYDTGGESLAVAVRRER